MARILKPLLPFLLVPLCFAGGLYGAPVAFSLYAQAFPGPEYERGHFEAIYAKARTPVVMYTSSTCPYCAKARRLLTERGVQFTEYQVDKSEADAAEFQKLGGQYVPVIYIGERRIAGFREQAIDEALAEIEKKS